jgi:hypothetical protein
MDHPVIVPVERVEPGTKPLAHPPYEVPAVIYEASLEVRAGSPLGIPDPLDLFD